MMWAQLPDFSSITILFNLNDVNGLMVGWNRWRSQERPVGL
jgi:hypothetical protein